jgi:hypothetical protein
MSVRVMSAVWELNLPPSEKLVLLALADCANDEGVCWPSACTLARKSGQGERTVRRCVQSLISKGHLAQDLRSGTSPVYRVNPCHSGTPAKSAPLPQRPQTPATLAPKPLGTVIRSEAKASSLTPANDWHPLPVGWVPTRPLSANTQAQVDLWPPGALESELESFRAWAANAPPQKGRGLKKDWDDAFGNWIRSQHRDRYSRQQHHTRQSNPTLDILRAANDAIARSEAGEGYSGAGLALPPPLTG